MIGWVHARRFLIWNQHSDDFISDYENGDFQFWLVHQNDLNNFVLVSLLLTLRSDFIFFWCFYCLWTSENGLGEFVNLVYQKFIGGWGCGHFGQKTVGKWASHPWDSYPYVRAKVVVSYVMLPGANDIKTCFLYINRLKFGMQKMGCDQLLKVI